MSGDKKLVAKGYEGEAVKAVELKGLQATVRETFSGALFIECFVHELILVAFQSCN